jgi:hydroxypyruvate reductase
MARDPRQLLLEIFSEALRAVNGREVVRTALIRSPVPDPTSLICIGKAACAMALGARDALGGRIRDALVVTKEGYAEPLPWPVYEAGHPLPNAASLAAGQALLEFIACIPAEATVLVLLSGGASALIEVLPEGVSLDDLQRANAWLLGSGLDIAAMNRIRKRLSLIKGGRLAQLLAPRVVRCLAISDVPNDDPRAIGSGPLVPGDDKPIADETLPDFLRTLLQRGTPAPGRNDPCFTRVSFEIVATLGMALDAARRAAVARGFMTVVEPDLLTGNAAQTGRRLAQQAVTSRPGTLLLRGGETTVQLPPVPGRGGRNQTLALAAATALQGHDGTYLLAAGTDGSDGPTPDAGALVDGGTIARGVAEGLDADTALARADAGTFLEASGDLIQTGPTGTNVMDLVLGLHL